MKRLTVIGIMSVALVSGVLSYLYAGSASVETPAQARQPMSHLLELSPEQERVINSADPRFLTDAAEFATKLDAEQEKLASLLEDPGSGKEETMAQVEALMLAHNNLERRVAKHVLEVREHLTPEQRKKLMGLMAGRVRVTQTRMQRCRWGWGRGHGRGRGGGGGRGRGGQGGGRGPCADDNDPDGGDRTRSE